VEALKDEVDDQCRRCKFNLSDGSAPGAGISLPYRKNKPIVSGMDSSQLSGNTIFSRAVDLSTKWWGYRSEEENKTPNIGVPAI